MKLITAGRVTLHANPSAVTGYNQNYADLVRYVSGNAQFLSDTAGLVQTFTYYASTTATSSTLGGVNGRLSDAAVRQGETGTSVPQNHEEYFARTAGSTTTYLPGKSTVYTNNNGTGALSTTQGYTYYSGAVAIQSQTATDSAGSVTTVFYDIYGRPVWTKDAAGYISYTAYDQKSGAVVKAIQDVDTSRTTDFTGLPTGWTTPTGGGLHLTTAYEVDALGRTTKLTDANGNLTYTVYNDANHEARIYPGWNSTTNTPTGPTVVVRDDRANSYAEVLTMSAAPATSGSRPTGTEPIGNLQSLSRTLYTAGGQATEQRNYFNLTGLTYSTSLALGALNTNYYRTQSGFDTAGRENRTVRGDGTIYRTVFDGLGRPKSDWIGADDTGWTDAAGAGGMTKVKSYTYDNGGTGDSLLTSVADAMNRVTSFAYDFRARQFSLTLPDPDAGGPLTAPVHQTAYDNLDRITSETDPLGNVTSYAYDTLNRTLTTTLPDPDGAGSQTSPVTVETFDPRGLVASLKDPVNNTTSWQYDGLGRAKSETNQLSKSRTFQYDGLGHLAQSIDRLARKIEYSHDKSGRPTAEKWYDGANNLMRTISYTYDAAGRLSQATDPAATYGFNYDALGQVTYQSQSLAGSSPLIEYTTSLNAAGNITSLSAIIGGTADFKNTFTYDTFARLQSVNQQSVAGGNAVAPKRADFSSDNSGLTTKIARFADAAGTELAANSFYSYDGIGRLSKLLHAMDTTAPASGWGTNPLAGYQFTYDTASRLATSTSYLDGLTTYTLDNTSQLTAADHTGQTDESYSYDANGNRTMTGYSTGTNNRLASDGTYNYTYDDEGNRLTKTTIATGEKQEFTWDHRNRLTKITFKNASGVVTKTVDQAYDVFNQWIRRSVDSDGPGGSAATDIFFSYEGGQAALQFDGSSASNLSHRYLWGPNVDQLLADENVVGSSLYWTLGDNVGTIYDLATHNSSNHTTTIANHRSYDEWGKLLSESNSAIDSIFAYTGRQFDEATGLQNNLNRWYDPSISKWVSEDPIGFQGDPYNLYRYVGNNATTRIDPNGLEQWTVTVGAVTGTLTFSVSRFKGFTVLATNAKGETMEIGDSDGDGKLAIPRGYVVSAVRANFGANADGTFSYRSTTVCAYFSQFVKSSAATSSGTPVGGSADNHDWQPDGNITKDDMPSFYRHQEVRPGFAHMVDTPSKPFVLRDNQYQKTSRNGGSEVVILGRPDDYIPAGIKRQGVRLAMDFESYLVDRLSKKPAGHVKWGVTVLFDARGATIDVKNPSWHAGVGNAWK